MGEKLNILTAGVAKAMVEKAAAEWDKSHADMPCEIYSGGSVDLIRRLIAGTPCDILISADDAIVDSMLIPEYADSYRIFAGNRMVITSLHGKEISDEDWVERLLDKDNSFGYSDPMLDPGGYRAEMALLLADCVEEGLADKLMQHPGRKILAQANDNFTDYKIYYYTKCYNTGRPFAELPVQMNLSDPAYNDIYRQAVLDLGDVRVEGGAINHVLVIPKTAEHIEAAEQFSELFLAQDFEAEGFCKR